MKAGVEGWSGRRVLEQRGGEVDQALEPVNHRRPPGGRSLIDVRADRPEVDHRAAPAARIIGRDRLGGEEVVAQVDVEPVVPLLHAQRLDRVPLIVGRVVDQHRDGAEPLRGLGDPARSAATSRTSQCR